MSEVVAEIQKLGERTGATLTNHQKNIEELLERVERIETGAERPKGTSKSLAPEGHQRFHTKHGEIVQVDSKTRLADVMRPAKAPEVSFSRWLGALVAGDACGDREAIKHAQESKAVATTSTGVLIPAQYISEWIDLIRAQSVLQRAGAQTVVMDAKTQTRSAVTADPTAAWHSEAGSISATDPTFAARVLTAQTLTVRTTVSLELTQDSPDFGLQLSGVFARAMAAELDRVGLHGSGTPPEPRGIYNTSNIGTVTSVGTMTDFTKIVTGVKTLLSANCPLDVATRYAIMSPASWLRLENLVTGIASDKTQLARPKSLENTEFLVTSNVAINIGSPERTAIFLGDFTNLILGMRHEASVEILKVTAYATNLQLEVIGYLRGDYIVTRPNQFCVLTGVTP